MSTPSLGFRFGAALGTVTREFLRATREQPDSPWTTYDDNRKKPHQAETPAVGQGRILREFGPLLSTTELSNLDRTPAFVRKTSADLGLWFQNNTREVVEAKKRTRRRKAQPAQAETPVPPVTEPKRGSLDQLIAPVEPAFC